VQSRMDNPETQAHKTRDIDKQNRTKRNTTHKTKMMSNTDPPKYRDEPRCAWNWKEMGLV